MRLSAMALAYIESTLAMGAVPCLHQVNVAPVEPPQRFAYLTFAAAWNRWLCELHSRRPRPN